MKNIMLRQTAIYHTNNQPCILFYHIIDASGDFNQVIKKI